MKLTGMIGVSLAAMFAAGSVYAADESAFAVLNGAQAEVLNETTMDSTFGKHFTVELPNGSDIHASGTNSPVMDHVTLTLGGGAAVLDGLPCAVCLD